ncbi:MAG: hypothetical protein ACRD1N_03830 [Terriglobia bacterium]
MVRIEAANGVASLPVIADVTPGLRKALSSQGYQVTQRAGSNSATIRLVLASASAPAREAADAPESFTWEPLPADRGAAGGTLAAPAPLSLEAGILWLADRVACTGKIPVQEHKAVRAFARSFTYLAMPQLTTQGKRAQSIAAALKEFRQSALIAARYGATDLVIYGANHVVVWDSASRPSAKLYREFYRRAAQAAHQLGLRLFLYGDELIYQPVWLKAQGARLSTSDPRLWQALAAKYRQVLTAAWLRLCRAAT